MEQLERIQTMEAALCRAQAAVSGLALALDAYRAALPDLAALDAYLQSDEWKADFAADEAGALPEELRRGVLSEDGIYDLLTENDALRARLADWDERGCPEAGAAEAALGPDCGAVR